jgi:hypothetical protein
VRRWLLREEVKENNTFKELTRKSPLSIGEIFGNVEATFGRLKIQFISVVGPGPELQKIVDIFLMILYLEKAALFIKWKPLDVDLARNLNLLLFSEKKRKTLKIPGGIQCTSPELYTTMFVG